MRIFKNVKDIEIYRYGIISPVLHGSEQYQNEYFRQLSQKGIKIPPDSEDIFYLNPSTFKRWLRLFRQQGLEGLKEKSRSDKGTFRKVPSNLLDAITSIIQEEGAASVSDLHRKLLMGKHITHETISYETLRQLVKRHRLLSPHKSLKPRKKFEKEFINELWMVDFKQGKSIRNGNRLQRSYLCAIIDDASRLLVGYEWGLNEDTTLFARTFKKAVSIYGIPHILYSDQGKVFQSRYIMELCARLGISLLNAEPYSPESKGKIERFNRTIQQMFYPIIKDFRTIDCQQLNQLFDTFVQEIYHKKTHGSLNESPLQKFQRLLSQVPIRRLNQDELDQFFLCSLKRRVRLDGTIVYQNVYYEVGMKYAGDMIELRFPVDNPNRLFLFDKGCLVKRLKPVNLVVNANPPRISTSYSTLLALEKEKEKEKDKDNSN
jgi:transposase InsO family protein